MYTINQELISIEHCNGLTHIEPGRTWYVFHIDTETGIILMRKKHSKLVKKYDSLFLKNYFQPSNQLTFPIESEL